jgi:fatty acid desaturase
MPGTMRPAATENTRGIMPMNENATKTSSQPWIAALSAEERRRLAQVQDWRGWVTIVLNWAIVAGAFAMVALHPSVLTVIVALFLIGGRQLGCAIVMHEAAHRSLLKNASLNDWVGNWLASYPVWLDLKPYRSYHLQHHTKNWTEDDPDLGLALAFPVTRKSLLRKIWRDLSGQTGWKRAKVTLMRDLGRSKGKVRRADAGAWALRGVIVTNLAMLALLALFGHAELYLLWVAAWFTTFSFVMRIRAIAEHSMTDDPTNPLRNTRTTLASWWERIFIAPNRVNYHLEHHLFMGMPLYSLPKLHRMLRERGVLDDACVERGYARVLRKAGAALADPAAGTGSSQTLTFG